jgi:hypothetical protein
MAERQPPRLLRFALSVCLALGALGVGSGIGAVSSWNEPLQLPRPAPLPERPAGADEATWQALEDLYSRFPEVQLEVMTRRRPALNALAVVDLVSSAVLFAGALLALSRTPHGLATLRAGLGLSEAYAAISLVVNLSIEREVLAALSIPPGTSVVSLAVAAAQVISALILAAQLVFYVAVHIWVSRPSAAASLAPRT